MRRGFRLEMLTRTKADLEAHRRDGTREERARIEMSARGKGDGELGQQLLEQPLAAGAQPMADAAAVEEPLRRTRAQRVS